MFENWQSNGDALTGYDPHINFIQVFHHSPQGLNQLQIHWDATPGLYFAGDKEEGSSTFAQPGNITLPHVDGFGLLQRTAHLNGHKIWIVWPPTEHNLRAVRDHSQALGPTRELRFERWFQELQQPEVFHVKEGDSFFLGPLVLHACISVTKSAHFGIFCWRRESLGVAQLNMRILQEGYESLVKELAEQGKRRRKEDREENLNADQHRNRDEDREKEDDHMDVCLKFYQGFKKDWNLEDKRVWNKMNVGKQDEEINQWILDVEKFLGKIRSKAK